MASASQQSCRVQRDGFKCSGCQTNSVFWSSSVMTFSHPCASRNSFNAVIDVFDDIDNTTESINVHCGAAAAKCSKCWLTQLNARYHTQHSQHKRVLLSSHRLSYDCSTFIRSFAAGSWDCCGDLGAQIGWLRNTKTHVIRTLSVTNNHGEL